MNIKKVEMTFQGDFEKLQEFKKELIDVENLVRKGEALLINEIVKTDKEQASYLTVFVRYLIYDWIDKIFDSAENIGLDIYYRWQNLGFATNDKKGIFYPHKYFVSTGNGKYLEYLCKDFAELKEIVKECAGVEINTLDELKNLEFNNEEKNIYFGIVHIDE